MAWWQIFNFCDSPTSTGEIYIRRPGISLFTDAMFRRSEFNRSSGSFYSKSKEKLMREVSVQLKLL